MAPASIRLSIGLAEPIVSCVLAVTVVSIMNNGCSATKRSLYVVDASSGLTNAYTRGHSKLPTPILGLTTPSHLFYIVTKAQHMEVIMWATALTRKANTPSNPLLHQP